MKKVRINKTAFGLAPIVLGVACIAIVLIEQQAFESMATTIVVYVIASIVALAAWYGCVALAAIGALGRITKIGGKNPPTLWLMIVVMIATIAGSAALFGTVELFRFFLSS